MHPIKTVILATIISLIGAFGTVASSAPPAQADPLLYVYDCHDALSGEIYAVSNPADCKYGRVYVYSTKEEKPLFIILMDGVHTIKNLTVSNLVQKCTGNVLCAAIAVGVSIEVIKTVMKVLLKGVEEGDAG